MPQNLQGIMMFIQMLEKIVYFHYLMIIGLSKAIWIQILAQILKNSILLKIRNKFNNDNK